MLRDTKSPRILHIVTDLNGFGGTEATLYRYLKASVIPSACHLVIVLKSIGENNTIGAQIVRAGFNVIELGQTKGGISFLSLWKIRQKINEFLPDIISGWLYQPSLLATFFANFTRTKPRVVWHIRSLTFGSLLKTPVRYISQLVLVALSWVSQPFIISNSKAAIREHRSMMFNIQVNRLSIIPNGIDILEYFPNYHEGQKVRSELGIPANALLIGCVGRFVPEKGYPIFFSALKIALDRVRPDIASRIHFLGCGDGVDLRNLTFKAHATNALGIEKLHLLDKRADIPRLLRSLDVFVLPSLSEAFPNSLIEAMATGLTCIGTNVGECAIVLNKQNYIVPPSDVESLATCICNVIEMSDIERAAVGAANQQRVTNQFELRQMVKRFDELFRNIANHR